MFPHRLHKIQHTLWTTVCFTGLRRVSNSPQVS